MTNKPLDFNRDFLSFSNGNAKLKKDTLITSLPAGQTCPGADICQSMVILDKEGNRKIKDGKNCEFRCFAASEEVRRNNIYLSRKTNYELINYHVQRGSFYRLVNLIERSIDKKKTRNTKKIRIHQSGDFYKPLYLKSWLKVADNNPQYKFYCYSKSLNLFLQKELPDNFFLTASVGGKYDYLIHKGYFKRYAIVVNNEDEARALGMLHIGKPYEIDHDDSHCFGSDPFALLVHGTQPKGSKAAQALSERKKQNKFVGYSK